VGAVTLMMPVGVRAHHLRWMVPGPR